MVNILLSATELAASEIRSRIAAGTLTPGDRVNGDEIGKDLGISRTPIRDALQRLQTEGLVEIQPRVGAFVREITSKEVFEVYTLKIAIEPLAAEWAAELGTASERAKLQSELKGLQSAAVNNSVEEAVQRVDAIHDLIFAMTQSQVLVDVYNIFRGRVRMLRQLNLAKVGRIKVSAEQHARIVTAITQGKKQKAKEAMLVHLKNAGDSVQSIIVTQ